MSNLENYVTYGCCSAGTCGTSLDITGCRFSLSPMSDQFIEIILDAVSKADTTNVWSETGKLSTVFRGKRVHVLDAVKACFLYAYRDNIHMTMEATFSRGCPGDTDAEAYLAKDDAPLNAAQLENIHFPAICKVSLYPMGISDYMKHIAHVVNEAINRKIYLGSPHYVTELSGDIHELFDYFNYVNEYCAKHISHYVFEVTLSVNSPTK